MRKLVLLVLASTSLAGPAFAQATRGGTEHGARPRAGAAERPLDRGPFTPEANRAYNGGGMVLEGAPGGPPPVPQPTAPPVAPQGARGAPAAR